MATKSCSGVAILENRHSKSNAFLTSENERAPLTMENVTYSDFTKKMKNACAPPTMEDVTREAHPRTPEMTPDPLFIPWQPCGA